jgi:hypothetical protein
MGVPELVWREAAAHSRRDRRAPQFRAGCRRCPVAPARSAVDHAQQRTDRKFAPHVKPRLKLFPSPCVHADLAATPALAAPHQERATAWIEITLGERSLATPSSG